MADNLRASVDQFLRQRFHQPVFERLGRGQRAQEVAEIVGWRTGLKANAFGVLSARSAASTRLPLGDPLTGSSVRATRLPG